MLGFIFDDFFFELTSERGFLRSRTVHSTVFKIEEYNEKKFFFLMMVELDFNVLFSFTSLNNIRSDREIKLKKINR